MAADGLKTMGGAAEFAAQPRDFDVDAALARLGFAARSGACGERASRNDDAATRREALQQLAFARRQMHRVVTLEQYAEFRVEAKGAKARQALRRRVILGAARAPQDAGDAQHEFARFEGLPR